MIDPPDITYEDIAREYEDEQFLAWIDRGLAAGWISDPVCETHNGVPMREWEESEFEEGFDPCIAVIRLWHDGMENYTPEAK